jgi:hypothetical protein
VKATASLFTVSSKDQKKSFVGFWFVGPLALWPLGLLFVLKVSYP